jgi:hypothetical protein
MKKLFIAASIIVLFGFGIIWIYSGSPTQSTTIDVNGESTTLPLSGTAAFPTTSENPTQEQSLTTLKALDGTILMVRDFLRASTTGEYPNVGYYYLGYHTASAGVVDATATDNPPYLISYISATQYFNIALLQEPLGAIRSDAEQFLMTDLGISQDEMCRINYMVSVPDRVNSLYAGKNLGFSFCPGAVKLPN